MNTRTSNDQDAQTQFLLGNALLERQQGARLQNLDKALNAYKRAGKVYTYSEYPYEWALLQSSIGIALYKRVIALKKRDMQEAIDQFNRALLVITQENYPQEWAEIQGCLASTYQAHFIGNYSENLEKALEISLNVLDFFSLDIQKNFNNWAGTQNNIGLIYIHRTKGNIYENLQKAIQHFSKALEFVSADRMPDLWAGLKVNMGRVFAILFLNSKDNDLFEQAEACFQNALLVRTPERLPLAHQVTAGYLADLYFDKQMWEKAYQFYESAILVGDKFQSAAFSDENRQVEISHTSQLNANAAYCLFRLNKFDLGLLKLENGKTQLLGRALALSDETLRTLPSNDQEIIRIARDSVTALEIEWKLSLDNPKRRGNKELDNEILKARAQLEVGLKSLSKKYKSIMQGIPNIRDILSGIPYNGALLMLAITYNGAVAVVLPYGINNISEENIIYLDNFKNSDLQALLWGNSQTGDVGWMTIYQEVRSGTAPLEKWQEKITKTTAMLWQRLMQPIHDKLLNLHVKRVTIIPQGGLQLLPLHAAWKEDTVNGKKIMRYFLDEFEIAYAPSAYVLLTSKRRAENRTPVTALVAGVGAAYRYLPLLKFSIEEAKSIAAILGVEPILDFDATSFNVQTRSSTASYIHLSCHGSFSWHQGPLDSAIYLAYDKSVTLSEIITNFKFDNTRLVTLSACETGLCESSILPDEFIGLPAGFLQAGAAGVISSLWMVDDKSTQLLMCKFYEYHLHENKEPTEALHLAQYWLRNATRDQIGDVSQAATRLDINEYKKNMLAKFEINDRPYASPYYWAAFTITGA